MTAPYDPKDVEPKWRRRWEDSGVHTPDLADASDKLYCLVMFSYPSGDKLHIGHWYNYGPTDTWARFKRMQGRRIFEPMGFDAFGLPAENHAIKTGSHPKDLTEENTATMEGQIHTIGAMYDWTRKVDTSKPDYYRWTQWVFLKLHERGLAYRKLAPVNWCPSCRTVLANEQVQGGCCERCESEATKKDLEQWFFKATDHAERLLKGLDTLDWPEKTLAMQRNWIGRSEGANLVFDLAGRDEALTVFTTRADTLFGATYMVLAPEHPFVDRLTTGEHRAAVEAYREQARRTSEIDRTSAEREKTGIFTGAYARNPVNGETIPVWIADYVLMGYGTGAIMAVPAHDERDFEFAKQFNLPIRQVIRPEDGAWDMETQGAFVEGGVMMNSGEFDGSPSEQGGRAVVAKLNRQKRGEETVHYRLRDWLISRQRYWGAPIPMLYCKACGIVPEKEKNLPVLLPYEIDLSKSRSGKSPLAFAPSFVAAKCPACGGAAKREVDTMDTFVDSSWYFLRYPSPNLEEKPWDAELVKTWLPVDMYVGGAEHACMHLLYARFITMALHDAGLVPFEEPFPRLRHQGVITNRGAKMSKSRGNVVAPEPYLEKYGSDVFRMFLMFMGPYSDGGDWSDSGIHGIARFRDRVWRLFGAEGARKERPAETDAPLRKEFLRILHFTIREVTGDLENFRFNTALSRLMELSNFLQGSAEKLSEQDAEEALKNFAQLLAPLAPHMGEELWERFVTSPPAPLSREGEGEAEGKTETRSPGYIFERARELRKSATDAEKLLWKCLRDRALEGFKFRRQHPIKRYIADFFCQEASLVIEVEGSAHDERNQEEYDKIRKESLEGLGCTVLRFRNEDVLSDVEGVLRTVLDALPAVPLSFKGEGVPKGGGEVQSIFDCGWPGYDPKRIETAAISVVVQVNGRKRGEISVPKDASEEQVREAALADERVARHVPDAKRIARAVYVPGRLVNFVVK